MGKALKFFLNAFKAIFLSPFYLIYFAIYLIATLINFLVGEVRVLISGFRYGSDLENKYQRVLKKRKQALNNGGEQS